MHEPADEGDDDAPWCPTCCAPATRWKGRVVRPAMVKVRG